MSDIFLSYSSKDVERAKQLAEALTRQGWSVWWDRSILPGKIFDRVIEAELAATHCVIVLWSNDSVESSWVRAEAEVAMKKGHLIPALLGDVTIPLVFRQFQAASLLDWDGSDTHPGFQQLLNAIRALLPQPALSAAVIPPQSSVANETVNSTAASDSSTNTRKVKSSKQLHRYFNTGAWVLVLMLAGALAYINLLPEDRSDSSEVTRAPAVPSPPSPPLEAQPSDAKLETIPQQEQTETTVQNPAPVHEPLIESAKVQQASPDLPPSQPITTKPAPVVPSSPPEVVATPQPAPRQIAASTTPSPAPVESATPLTILTVTWAMPSDKGVATSARVQDYSTKVAKSMTTVLQTVLHEPASFDYFYPTQQEYYRLLKDKNSYAESQALCNTKKTDLVVSAFIPGAKFVSASYGYELTREPVFSVFDCKTGKKLTNSYQIAENNQDSFPYEISFSNVFRMFVEQKADLNKY